MEHSSLKQDGFEKRGNFHKKSNKNRTIYSRVIVHGYKVKPRITLIFTDSFLANKLFYDKIIYYNR